jgi:hypothetical protein
MSPAGFTGCLLIHFYHSGNYIADIPGNSPSAIISGQSFTISPVLAVAWNIAAVKILQLLRAGALQYIYMNDPLPWVVAEAQGCVQHSIKLHVVHEFSSANGCCESLIFCQWFPIPPSTASA